MAERTGAERTGAERTGAERAGAERATGIRGAAGPATDGRIVRRKLSDEVFDRLKTMILDGEVAAGRPLPSERELMERFGVGRPAIREALQALSNLGLVAISHGERARVLEPSPTSLFQQIDLPAQILLSASSRSLENLLEARLFFECGVVRAVAERAGPADVQALGAAVEAQRAALPDVAAFIRLDMRFHGMLAALHGNPIFVSVGDAILGWLRRYHTEMLHWRGKENLTLGEHEAIVARIAAGDPDAAAEAMRHHLTRSSALYVHDRG